MSFNRIRRRGWAKNMKLRSSEANALDIDIANSVDKSGDTITGTTTVSGTIVIGSGSNGMSCSDDITVTGSGAELKTASSGRITLSDSDFPVLSSTHTGRSYTTRFPIAAYPLYSSSTVTNGDDDGIGVYYAWSAVGGVGYLMLNNLHRAATIDSVSVWFEAATGHTDFPIDSDRPSVEVVRAGTYLSTVAASTYDSLSSTGAQYLTMPSDVDDYNGNVYKITCTCDQNNTLPTVTDQYLYYVIIRDENGANAVAGNKFFAIDVTYSAIADMRFH